MGRDQIYHTMRSRTNPSTPFNKILMVNTAQARDKPAHRRHHAPDMRKYKVLTADELKHSDTLSYVLEGSSIAVGGGGAALLGLV